jgi:hypothetical protein
MLKPSEHIYIQADVVRRDRARQSRATAALSIRRDDVSLLS